VYVVASNIVKIHNITVAQTTGGTAGVSDGLQPGELVVTDGQDKLQEGTKVIPNQAPPATAPASANTTTSANPTYSNSSAPAAGPPTPSAKHGRGAKP
jgi:multidrug efflux system membrane fusion protein